MPFSVAAAAIPAVTAIAGAVSGGSGNSGGSSQSQTNAPWADQIPVLDKGFANASSIFDSRSATDPSGYYAPETGRQVDANGAVYQVAQNVMGSGGYGALAAYGNQALGQTGTYLANANNIASNGIGSQDPSLRGVLSNYATTGQMPGVSGADPRLASGVTNAAQGSLGSLGQGQTLANQVAARGLDTTGAMSATVNGAGQFINNGVLQGQIDALGTDISRNLNNTTLPGIRAAAAASGNTNSSREGALEAIAGSQAQENLLNAAASIRGTAYNTGATLANSQWGTGLGAASSAANALNVNGATAGNLATTQQSLQQQQGQFDTTSRLGAANTQQSQDLGFNTANTAAMLSGNGQIGNGLSLGSSMLSTALPGDLNAAMVARGAGDYDQAQSQAALSAVDQRQQSLLNDYWNIASKGYNGAQSSESTGSTYSGGGVSGALQGGLGGALTGYGVGNNLTGGALGNQIGSWFGTPGSAGSAFGGAGMAAVPALSFGAG